MNKNSDSWKSFEHRIAYSNDIPIIQELIGMNAGDNPIVFFRNFSFYFNSLVKDELKISTVTAHTADELSNEEKEPETSKKPIFLESFKSDNSNSLLLKAPSILTESKE